MEGGTFVSELICRPVQAHPFLFSKFFPETGANCPV